MENTYQKYRFSAINVKQEVAIRFRKFSKEISNSHSRCLEAMLNFFEWNNLSPYDNLKQETDAVKKRINALIAIVRNIEKHQTLPTKAMLDTMFQGMSQVQEEKEVDFELPGALTRDTEMAHYRKRHEEMQEEIRAYKNQLHQLIEQLDYVKRWFGKGYFKLELSKEELEAFKKKI